MSFKRFDQEDIVVSAESVTAPVWSGDQVSLTSFFTSSTQVGNNTGDFYYNVYQASASLAEARVQFSIAYGHKDGAGSLSYNSAITGSPSQTVYGQYRSLVLGDENAEFTFGGVASEHFYALSIDRARFKEKLLPGTLDLKLRTTPDPSVGRSLNLTDDSSVTQTAVFNDAGRVYQLISGSLGSRNTSVNSNGYTAGAGSYGYLLPDIGTILLNAKALASAPISGGLGLNIDTSMDTRTTNMKELFLDIQNGKKFRIQSEETVTSNFIFVRARNGEFNYSTNPSLITGSGELRHDTMVNSPQAYVTAVGLYNDNNDLLAVAKLSRPLLKDFTKEALVRIKLDY